MKWRSQSIDRWAQFSDRWYFQQGLVVTKIHEVVKYDPRDCSRPFGEMVTTARREADHNKQVRADSLNLFGNSVNGKCLENRSNHKKFLTLPVRNLRPQTTLERFWPWLQRYKEIYWSTGLRVGRSIYFGLVGLGLLGTIEFFDRGGHQTRTTRPVRGGEVWMVHKHLYTGTRARDPENTGQSQGIIERQKASLKNPFDKEFSRCPQA